MLLACVSIILLLAAKGHALTFAMLGDWGAFPLDMFGQREVANALALWAESNPLDFIISGGDNFYQSGVDSVNDPQFDEKWKYMYNHTSLRNVPWYITLGNHDHGEDLGEEWHQVEYSKKEPRWILPHLWHSWTVRVGNKTAKFIGLDTHSFRRNKNNHTAMLDWAEKEMKESNDDWKFVIGHRPVFSAGDTGPINSPMLENFRPLFEKYGVDMYLCGHDHNMQHMSHPMNNGKSMDFVISGAGGAANYPIWDDNIEDLFNDYNVTTEFALADYGFTTFQLTENQITVRHFNETVKPGNYELYNFVRRK